RRARLGVPRLILLAHGGPLPRGVLGGSPEAYQTAGLRWGPPPQVLRTAGQPPDRWPDAPGRYPAPAVRVLDPRFDRCRLHNSAVERIATGFRWAEGPVWF